MMTEQIIFEAPVNPRKAEQTRQLRLVETAQSEGLTDLAEARQAKRGQQYFRPMGLAA